LQEVADFQLIANITQADKDGTFLVTLFDFLLRKGLTNSINAHIINERLAMMLPKLKA
jgi:hypothetical protein